VVSPAMEFKKEGFILGTAANIFKLAGPVLLFGYFSSFIAGLLSLAFK
jgi:stage V sporulation protein AC